MLLGVVVEHMLHDNDVVVYYEIVNSYVPRMGIQADWYRPCNTNQRTTHRLALNTGAQFILIILVKFVST